jgi:serine/threonine-protein kinase
VLEPGATFAGHRIEGMAGRGGMGVVYRATHLALDHVVALKVISPDLAGDEQFRKRFQAESRIAVSIRHPNVVSVHHAGEEDGLLFVTMDLVEGTDLRGLISREGPLAPARAAAILGPIASALDAAHARGLVHRDIKPGNVLIEPGPDGEHVYLTDFGLARAIDAATGLTASGAFIGTLDYAAPEQIKGERLDARTDVYALGCVLHEMLTGSSPFARVEEKVAKMYAHLQEPPPSVLDSRADVPAELADAVARAMAKEPEERFPSAGDLARAAEAAVEGHSVTEVERTVATGEAAPPDAERVTPEPTTPAVALTRPAASPPDAAATAEPPPDGPRSAVAGRRLLLAGLAGIAAIAVVVVVVGLLLSGGNEDGSSGTPSPADDANEAGKGGEGGGVDQRPDLTGARIVGDPIPVDGMPVGIAAGFGDVWVASRTGGMLTRLDPRSGKPRGALSFDGLAAPEGITVGPRSVYVALSDADQVLRIDPEDRSPKLIYVGDTPRAIAHGGPGIYVTNAGSDDVTPVEVEPDDAKPLAPIAVGSEPHGIAIGEGSVWVTNRASGDVSRIEVGSNEVSATIPVGENPKGVAVAAGTVWVANTDVDTVSPIDPDSNRAANPIPVGDEPRGVLAAFDSVWVANGGGTVSRIDPVTAKVVDEIGLPPSPAGLPASPEELAADDDRLYVSGGDAQAVYRIKP